MIQDEVGGEKIQINFDIENRDGSVKLNGTILPSVNGYWFAWYAFIVILWSINIRNRS
jgi:hypothetical protein